LCNYNLFRHADRAGLICAVPEVRPVPAFITGPPWEFVGCVRDVGCVKGYANGSPGFNHGAAEESVHFNGFYLFQLLNASDLKLWVDRNRAQQCARAAPVHSKGRQWMAPEVRLPPC
jgi:hypothetical protein